jgi:segregation and condensation protein B
MNINQSIESILLFKGEPVSYKEMGVLLDKTPEEIKSLIEELSAIYKERGMSITFNDHECELVTNKEQAELISKLQKQETESELSNASLETLSIILYMGPIARSMIDFIRGVNSQFTLRSLLVRGLVEKDPNSKTPLYITSLDTIKFLGLNKVDELPNFKEIKHELAQFIKENTQNETR